MKSLIFNSGKVLAVTYAGLCVILFFCQRSFIYFPAKADQARMAAAITLAVPEATLRVSVRELAGSQALIYFGGNAEDVSVSLPEFAEVFPEHAIYMLHYRGYCGSSGTPTETALHSDAQALYDMVHSKHPNIIVVGRSLGSGVATRLASTNPVNRLVLVTPFDSILNMAKGQFPFLPVGLLLQDTFESWRCAPLVKAPTLILVAEKDEIIPHARTHSLFRNFEPGIANYKMIPSVGHNNISEHPEYMPCMRHGD